MTVAVQKLRPQYSTHITAKIHTRRVQHLGLCSSAILKGRQKIISNTACVFFFFITSLPQQPTTGQSVSVRHIVGTVQYYLVDWNHLKDQQVEAETRSTSASPSRLQIYTDPCKTISLHAVQNHPA